MFEIRKAEKRQAKLRLALIGVSGSGKSMGAIHIAIGMEKKFIVIDTEQTSADLYADIGAFDVLPLDKPFTPDRYVEAIKYAESQGYELIVIDSLSHAWVGEGGVLDMQDAATQASKSKNSYTAWREVTPCHNRLINAILHSKAHIIATMRVKTHYEIVEVNGKKTPIKLGLAPVQREGLDYEFTVVLDLDKDSHLYSSSKDRTRLFEGKHEMLTQDTGKRLMEWLMSGKSSEEVEREETARLKENMLKAHTLDALREGFRQARSKFPALESEFLAIADKRKLELSQPTDNTNEVH